jgi:hypothetical protein
MVVDEASKMTADKLRAERTSFRTFPPGEDPSYIGVLTVKQAPQPKLGPVPEGAPPRNFLPIEFQVHSRNLLRERLVLIVKVTCQVGDRLITTTTAPLIDLEGMGYEAVRDVQGIPFGKDGFVGDATTCELGFFLDPQGPGARPYFLSARCWTGGQVTDDACKLPRLPVRGKRLEVISGDLRRVEADLAYDYLVLVGNDLAGDELLEVEVTCGGTVVKDTPIVSFAYALAGESVVVQGKVTRGTGDCEAKLRAKPVASGPVIDLGTICLRDGATTTTAGACP